MIQPTFKMLFLILNCVVIAELSGHSQVTEYEILRDFSPEEGSKEVHEIKRRAAPADPDITNTTTNVSVNEDNHKYYKSKYYGPGMHDFWYDLEDGSGTPMFHEKSMYSNTINTTFEFPYYGHIIKKVTITNKGFLFVGDRVHKFNASAQYIAPLMADFAAELHEDTKIRYIDTGSRFTAEWTNIKLRSQQVGQFSFQCSILNDGQIVFAYKMVPVPVREIKNDTFYVRVGFSDSFDLHYIKHGLFVDPTTGKIYTKLHVVVYYRYHLVELNKANVKNGSAFVMKPLPNCVLYKTCTSCNQNNLTEFDCKWCPRINRCSDGVDRNRHDWVVAKCYQNSETTCRDDLQSTTETPRISTADKQHKKHGIGHSGRIAGTVILVLVCVGVLMGIVLWCVYAYYRPDTKSGMCLMKYGNPAKWCRHSTGGAETTGNRISFKTMPEESIA